MSARIDIDVKSATWIAIREWSRGKLDACRHRNDAPLSSDETAALRGTIQAYKDLLALEVNPPPYTSTTGQAPAQPSDDASGRPRSGIAIYDE